MHKHTHTHKEHTCKHAHMNIHAGRRDSREEAALEGGSGLGGGGHGPRTVTFSVAPRSHTSRRP